MSHASTVSIGIDIGGTHMRVALVDNQGKIVRSLRHELGARQPEALLALIDQSLVELQLASTTALPIGVGLAAQIWVKKGIVAVAPNLGWKDVPFGDMLKDKFNRSVRMVNDLNAIAMGEAACAAGEAAQDLVCVFVGTGVGMGAVVDGRVVEGSDGLATELGHIKIASVKTGRLCGCGERGCLEAYTSGRHLPELFFGKVQAGHATLLLPQDVVANSGLRADALDTLVARGDEAAMSLWHDVSLQLACAIGNAVTLFNPRLLVLGGGVLRCAPLLRQQVLAHLVDYTAQPAQKGLVVSNTGLGDDAGVIGAALIAQQAG